MVELVKIKALVNWPLGLNGEYVSAINLGLRKTFQEPADGATFVHPKFSDTLKLPASKKDS